MGAFEGTFRSKVNDYRHRQRTREIVACRQRASHRQGGLCSQLLPHSRGNFHLPASPKTGVLSRETRGAPGCVCSFWGAGMLSQSCTMGELGSSGTHLHRERACRLPPPFDARSFLRARPGPRRVPSWGSCSRTCGHCRFVWGGQGKGKTSDIGCCFESTILQMEVAGGDALARLETHRQRSSWSLNFWPFGAEDSPPKT